MNVSAAQLLVEAVKGKNVSFAGIRRDQTSADFHNQVLQAPDVVLLASDLSNAVVSASLTNLS